MSNFMENGPSNHNGEAEQVWERPWTLEEMQKSSTNWSLAADSGLFLFLQDFSQRMLSKTHEIEKQLDGLIRDTKATDSRLHTVFNDFLMLSNTQFIENRVYDEEVEDPAPKPEAMEKQPEQEKTREQKEAELIPKVQEAVNYGLKVLESAFEQLDIKAGNSDSEDEETLEKVEPILEAKDLYVDRPLPYLIGSQAFMDEDDVGLGDLSSDEMSIGSDRDSVIESDVEEGDEVRDDDMHFCIFKPSVACYDDADEENEDEDSDIFGGSDKDEDELRKVNSVDDQDEMFKPPKMEDEEYSAFDGKGGLFSGGKGLFDDDEGDLFSDAPKTEPMEKEKTVIQTTEPLKTKKIPTGAVSIFPGNKLFGLPNDSDSLESKNSKSPVKPKAQAAPKRASVGGGLFDDEDDDDDFFSGKAPNKSTPGQENKMPTKTVDLFGEADEEEDEYDEGGAMFSGKASAALSHQDKRAEGEEETRPPEKKPPVGAISMFGPGTKNILEGLKKRRLSTSEESAKSEESGPPPEAVKSSPALGASEKTHSKSLFSDDEDSQVRHCSIVKIQRAYSQFSSLFKLVLGHLFNIQDEDDDEDKEPLFGFKTPANKTPSEAKVSVVSGAPSQFESTEEENVPNVAKDKIAEEKKSVEKKPVESTPSSDNSTEVKKKPVGAVSLFGGIDVLKDRQDTSKKQTQIQEEIADGDELQKEGPPPMESKGTKAKKTALSLFDDDDDDDDEDMNSDEIIPVPKASKSTENNALKDHGPRMKSTGVFQDEELLFSHTQQRDNDPDVDLFATSPKPVASQILSQICDRPVCFFQASLAVNPASLLPGAVPRIPGAVSVMPGLAPASLPAAAKPLPARDTIPDHRPSSEGGVSFDSPAQVSMLQNANKGRAKGAVRRRPQTRAARHLAAQESEEAVGESTSIQADEPVMAASLPTFNPVSVRPSALTIPVSTPAPDEAVRPKRFLDSGNDLFDSDDLFATKPVPSSKHKAKTPEEGRKKASKTEAIIASKKDQASSIFDSHGDDLFATVKQKPVQKAKQMSFLDDDDIFGAGSSKSADMKEPPKAQKKPKEVSLDASLFDDVDIFADLTSTTKPKEKTAKKKLEAKSIFDDDMDDIFSTGTTKPTVKPSSKSKKNQPAQDPISTVETGNNIFDDPLNAFGGN
uniref:WASH complex subunit FAM21-like n=1 Tax=Sinocyclocheilus grahami TaxID=75366 RepID=A0A672L1Z4_SINGR